VNHLPINFESHVRTMSDGSLHSLRMMHGSFFSENFERRLFQKLGLPYYGRTAYERSSRIFHESFLSSRVSMGTFIRMAYFLLRFKFIFRTNPKAKIIMEHVSMMQLKLKHFMVNEKDTDIGCV
jgi:hypothetical protein